MASILKEDLKGVNVKFDQCLSELHKDVAALLHTVAQKVMDACALAIIKDHDLVNLCDMAAVEFQYEDYVDWQVETLQAENAKLWQFIRSDFGEVKEDGDRNSLLWRERLARMKLHILALQIHQASRS